MTSSDELFSTMRQWMETFMSRSMRNAIRFTKENGLSMSQIGAMFHIHRRGATGVSGIGEELGVTSAAASQMIDRLVQQELLSRSEDPDDRRLKQIVLTEKGRQLMRESIYARERWLEDLVELLTPDEREQVVVTLRLLIEKANQLEAVEECPHPEI